VQALTILTTPLDGERKTHNHQVGSSIPSRGAIKLISPQDFATLEALVAFSRSMAGNAGGLLGGMAEQLELLAIELEGVPVAVRDIEHGKRYQVAAVSNAMLSDTLFNSYGKFREQEIPNLFASRY